MDKGSIPTPLHPWGLGEGENAKPALILRVEGQQSVSRGRAPRPRLSASVGIPWDATITVNFFLEFEVLPSPGTRRAMRAPLARMGKAPGPGPVGHLGEKNRAWPRDPAGGADHGAHQMAISREGYGNRDAERRGPARGGR